MEKKFVTVIYLGLCRYLSIATTLKIRFEVSGRIHLGSTVFKTSEKETQQFDHRKKYYLRHS